MINVITYACNLTNNLISKINEKYNQSVDDKFEYLSNKYKRDIHYIKNSTGEIFYSKHERYADGTFKYSFNAWDLLDKDDKDDVQSLISLMSDFHKDKKDLLNWFLSTSRKCLVIDKETNKILSDNLYNYSLFFSALPECVLQDKQLLMKGNKHFNGISIEDLDAIDKFSKSIPKEKYDSYHDKVKSSNIEEIITRLYALDFLVDF